jgi:hypothetical protein
LSFEITDHGVIVYEDVEYNNIAAFLSKIIGKRVKNYHKSLIIDGKEMGEFFVPSPPHTSPEVFVVVL